MTEGIVSLHADYRSGKEAVGGFVSRPTAGHSRPAVVLIHRYRGLDDGQRVVHESLPKKGSSVYRRIYFMERHFILLMSARCKKPRWTFQERLKRSLTTKTEIEMFHEALDKYKKKYEIEMDEAQGMLF